MEEARPPTRGKINDDDVVIEKYNGGKLVQSATAKPPGVSFSTTLLAMKMGCALAPEVSETPDGT